jgi:deoxyribonuclease-4
MALANILGAHVSISGGLHTAIDAGTQLGCQAIQIFTKNNRQWAYTHYTTQEAQDFITQQKQSNIRTVVSHASYLINLASPNVEVYTNSLRALEAECIRCDQLAIPYLVLHPGSYLSTTPSEGLKKIARSIDLIYEKKQYNVIITLENTAGQGTSLGASCEELATIYQLVEHKEQIGFCFDTCHAFAAGYDLRTEKDCEETFTHWANTINLQKLHVLHLNDSKTPFHSKKDRHEHIGQGYIGLNAFTWILHQKQFAHCAKIIETPIDEKGNHATNLAILRKLL